MPRVLHLPRGPNPPIYNPLQMQPTTVVYAASLALSAWWHRFFPPFSSLRQYQRSITYTGVEVHFDHQVEFFDAEYTDVEASGKLRKDGLQIQFDVQFFSILSPAGRERFGEERVSTARVMVTAQPIWVQADAHMSAVPARMADEICALFEDDEREDALYRTPVPRRTKEIEASGELVLEHEHPFRVYRQHVEHADQWYYPWALSFASAARDELCFNDETSDQLARSALGRPVSSIFIHYTRACFLFDRGVTVSRAFRAGERLVFVHRLVAEDRAGAPYATIIEELEGRA